MGEALFVHALAWSPPDSSFVLRHFRMLSKADTEDLPSSTETATDTAGRTLLAPLERVPSARLLEGPTTGRELIAFTWSGQQ